MSKELTIRITVPDDVDVGITQLSDIADLAVHRLETDRDMNVSGYEVEINND